jgi:hypothetical protein
LGAAAIVAAGDARLRRESRALDGKPILLEALARHIANAGLSIDAAKTQILRDAKDGLSEFLYQDAWARMSAEHKQVFIVLAQAGIPLTSHVVGWTCSQVGVPHTSWLNAFEETYFGSILEYGGEYEIELAPMAVEFFKLKGQKLVTAARSDVERFREAVIRKQQERDRALSTPPSDRIEAAFRTPEARAAKTSALLGKLTDADLWYEEAVAKDSQNSALFDRYAWFLMQLRGDLDKGGKMADIACRLDPNSAEAHFTRALIYYRQFDIASADQAVDVARKLGKPETICLLQKAKARMLSLGKFNGQLDVRSSLLHQTEALLDRARRSLVEGDPYYSKNLQACNALAKWLRKETEKGGLMSGRTYLG